MNPIPWYKNHILLLIILIPLATVCGSMYTIYLAVSSKEAPVLEDYSKTGLSPQKRHEGRTTITATLADGAITLQRDPPSIEPLTLTLQHASKAALDQTHTLQADAPNHYPLPAAVQQTLPTATWYLSLAPADKTWKIKGKYPHPKRGEPSPPATIPLANP
ncbi:FixH family protein [uncultured Cardiobacterium sp.]|uniref:FixH family protein n=1 Tax=uncultured Cardiobacterium sp. TaxID=417619 RepID=UPI002621FC5A|nr:FixH family protein [uncultured Cardiobacterium sp.]